METKVWKIVLNQWQYFYAKDDLKTFFDSPNLRQFIKSFAANKDGVLNKNRVEFEWKIYFEIDTLIFKLMEFAKKNEIKKEKRNYTFVNRKPKWAKSQ